MGWRRRMHLKRLIVVWSRAAVPMLTLLPLLAIATPCRAQSGEAATTSQAARKEAIGSIPIDELSREDARRVANVVNNAAIYRRLPTKTIECDPNLYLFLARYPDVIVGIWDLMGISNVNLQRTGERTFQASDNKGTLCSVELLNTTNNRQLYYAEGKYEGPLFQGPIKAGCVILLSSKYTRDSSGRVFVVAQVDTFIEIERTGLKLLAKTVQPLIGKAADYNFTETITFVERLSEVSADNPAGVGRMAAKLEHVDADIRNRFVAITEKIGDHKAAEQAEPTIREVKLDAPQSETDLDPSSRWRR